MLRAAPQEGELLTGLASPDIADAPTLTFALSVTAGWHLPSVQAHCEIEYDLYRDFDEDYWEEEDKYNL